MKIPALQRKLVIPQFGTIVGGLLAGWNYSFLRYEVTQNVLFIYLFCTPPMWPFGKEVAFKRGDLHQLKGGPGAKRMDGHLLIEDAKELAKILKQQK